MSLLISIICAAAYFAIAELIHKRITGRYFEFGYATRDKHDMLMTLFVLILSLSTAPFIVAWFNSLTS